MNLTGWVLGIRAWLGEWDSVMAEDTALEVEDATSVYVHGIVIPILVDRGQLDEARHRFELSVRFLDPDEVQDVAGFKMTESHVLLAEGRPRDALAAAEEAVARRGELAEGLAAVKVGYTLALAAAFELGDDARVDELLAIVERLPPGELSPYLRATGARFSARRAARISDNETAVAGFSAAAADPPGDRVPVRLRGRPAGARRVVGGGRPRRRCRAARRGSPRDLRAPARDAVARARGSAAVRATAPAVSHSAHACS